MKLSRPVAVLARTSALALALGLAFPPATAAAAPPAGQPVPPLGTWTGACGSGFRLSSMPSAWRVSPGEPVRVFTRLAVDFDALPEDAYAVEVSADGEKSHRLLGFGSGLLHAVVREARTGRVVDVLSGARLAAAGSVPAVHTWDGRDHQGQPVPPGVYEIEVRARMVPAWAEPWMREDAAYADLEGWTDAAEACTRALRVEVVADAEDTRAALGIKSLATSCAPAPSSYYAPVDASSPGALRSTLHQVIDDHVRFPYTSSSTDTWDILNDADENPANPSTVLDLYKNATFADGCSSGCAWNREHTWAKSYGFQTESGSAATPYTDAHHLRTTDAGYNSARSNLPHGECVSGCSEYPTEVNAGFGGSGQPNRGTGGSISCTTPTAAQVWEVWDHRKGDVARSILYMDLRYEGGTGPLGAEPDLIASDDLSLMYAETTSCGDGYMPVAYHGMLSTLLAWHTADPPDADEIRRNDQVWCYQQNRNPFVDHPEWVDCIYLGSCGGGGAPSFGGIVSAADANACAAGGVTVTWAAPSAWNDGCTSGCSRGFRVLRNGAALASGGCAAPLAAAATSCTDTTAVAGTTYTYAVEAFNNQAETSTGGTTATAADRTNDGVAPVLTAGPTVTATTTASFTVTWTTDEPSDGRVEYGLTTAYGSVVSNATLATSHSFTVTGLAAGTTYHFRVGSTDACGTGPRFSADLTATTQTSGGGGAPLAVGGYTLTQANATYVFTLPAGTTVPANGYLVVARNADKAAFEAFWDVTLGADAAFLNSAGGMPVINGSETYTLADAGGTVLDGPTIAMGSSGAQSIRRIDPCQAAGLSSSWAIGAESAATVGSGAGAGCGRGLVINEFSDASGSGGYVFEFLELHYDAPAPADTTAPVASITSPANGATVSGTVEVAATATDAVGVTKVEFLLDGALQATDTTPPYTWTWATPASADGGHSLVAKAYDAAGNVGTSSTVGVTVSNATGTSVGGWRIVQASSTLTYTIPAGTVIPANGYLVVGRNAAKAAFETYWRTTLGTNVVYLSGGDVFPQINGSESFTLYNASGTKVDGKTVSMASTAAKSYQRKDPCLAAGKSTSWTVVADASGTPGRGAGAGCAAGVRINEFSDASGTGNYVYEFVELHADN